MSGLIYEALTNIKCKGAVLTVGGDPLIGGWYANQEYGDSDFHGYGRRLVANLVPQNSSVETFKGVYVNGISYSNIYDISQTPNDDDPDPVVFNILLATDTLLNTGESTIALEAETAAPNSQNFPTWNDGSGYAPSLRLTLKENKNGIYLYQISDLSGDLPEYAGEDEFYVTTPSNQWYASASIELSTVKWIGNIIAISAFNYSDATPATLEYSKKWYTRDIKEEDYEFYPSNFNSVFFMGYIYNGSQPGPYGSLGAYGSSNYGSLEAYGSSSSYGSLGVYGNSSYGSSNYGGGSLYDGSSYGGSSYGDPGYGGGYTDYFTQIYIDNQDAIYGYIQLAFINYVTSANLKVNNSSIEIWEDSNVNNFKLGHYNPADLPISPFKNPPNTPAEVVAVFKDTDLPSRIWSLLHSQQLIFNGLNYSSKFSSNILRFWDNEGDGDEARIEPDRVRVQDAEGYSAALVPGGVRLNDHDLISAGTTDIGAGANLTTGCVYLVYTN